MNTQGANIPDFLKSAIKMRLEEEAEKLIEEAKKKLHERTPEIVAGVAVDIMRMVEIQDFKERVVFTIKKQAS